jgi:hypothetical protein
MENDFSDVLDAIKEKPEAVQNIGMLAHRLTMAILTSALEGEIDAKRMANRSISPMSLANQCARECIRVIEEELTKEI